MLSFYPQFTSVFVLISLWTTMVLGLDWLPFIGGYPVPSLVPGALKVLLPLIFEVVIFALAMGLLYLGVKKEWKRVGWASVGCQVSRRTLEQRSPRNSGVC